MWLDEWLAACLVPLAVWLVLSGLDDLAVAAGMLLRRRGRALPSPSESELARAPHRSIALFLPLWREHTVVERMLGYNLSAVRYRPFNVFVGAYPNDPDTQAAVRRVCSQFDHVHLVVCPHPGPTSKADCLNWIFDGMLDYERRRRVRFDIVVVHDAEDLIHPRSLPLINYWMARFDMVQVPVLPLPTPWWDLTHGLYCDEFAEFQSKDIPVRRAWRGFLPSNGVGTGYSRAVLDSLARGAGGRVFEPGCLTEDYDIGYRIHRFGCPQLFLPIQMDRHGPVATRAYFPRDFPSARRQRTRWVTGISLQGWQRHGWGVSLREAYWFWRDRKGLIGNLLAPAANLVFLYGAAEWLGCVRTGGAWTLGTLAAPALAWLCGTTLAVSLAQLAVRGCCAARIYGWAHALGVPVRAVYGNWLNCVATLAAVGQYAAARLRRRAPRWIKTEHIFPRRPWAVLPSRRLGEVLLEEGALSAAELQAALASRPAGRRLAEHLVACGTLTEEALCRALGRHHQVPLGIQALSPPVTRALPTAVARRWKVLPFRVAGGALYLAGPELPSERMLRDLRRFCPLEPKFHLVTPAEWNALALRYLPAPLSIERGAQPKR